jgi:hypothetical protein
MRITWLSAWVVTPSDAARSKCGVMTISGRRKSALMRGATTCRSPLICVTSVCAVRWSRSGSDPASMTLIARPEPLPGPALFWLAKLTRASATC